MNLLFPALVFVNIATCMACETPAKTAIQLYNIISCRLDDKYLILTSKHVDFIKMDTH